MSAAPAGRSAGYRHAVLVHDPLYLVVSDLQPHAAGRIVCMTT